MTFGRAKKKIGIQTLGSQALDPIKLEEDHAVQHSFTRLAYYKSRLERGKFCIAN